MFMNHQFPEMSKYRTKKIGSAAAALAPLAAIFPEVVGERAQVLENRGVVVVGALVARRQEPCIHEPFEVMTERGSRHVDVALNLTRRGAASVPLNHEAQDAEPDRVAQSGELFCVVVEFSH